MSGLKSDKWQNIFLDKINYKIWAGAHKPNVMPLLEFPKSKININYPDYRNYLDKNFNNDDNFYKIWYLYLRAHKLLVNKNKKKYKFEFIYAESGLRRELLYLAKNKFNFICLVPVRKFETFYYSKIKSLFNTTKITKKYIYEAWGHWFHKTSDYLYLKKKYPKNFFIVPYEDFANKKKRKESMKKICNFLKIKFSKINLKNTHLKKKVSPNSSFRKKGPNPKNLYYNKNYQFPSKNLPKDYIKFYKKLGKFFYMQNIK